MGKNERMNDLREIMGRPKRISRHFIDVRRVANEAIVVVLIDRCQLLFENEKR